MGSVEVEEDRLHHERFGNPNRISKKTDRRRMLVFGRPHPFLNEWDDRAVRVEKEYSGRWLVDGGKIPV
jgi:hypothetical protein